jgi:haloalkane dehalogenase
LLLVKGSPGAVIPESRVKWLQEKVPHLVVRDIGPGIHYLQEDNPKGIGINSLNGVQRLFRLEG